MALKRGFNEVVPASFMDMFDERELELMLAGLGAVDLADWRAHTDYRHCAPDTPVVAWFWRFVETRDPEMRARLLQFVTGTSRVPVTGFRDLQVRAGDTAEMDRMGSTKRSHRHASLCPILHFIAWRGQGSDGPKRFTIEVVASANPEKLAVAHSCVRPAFCCSP